MFEIVPERPEHIRPREALLDLAFGSDRHQLTTYRLRSGVKPLAQLSYVALADGAFQGSLRFWPILLSGARSPLLLGPLAVDPVKRGQAIGVALVRNGLRKAHLLGHDMVVLVGDHAYYRRFGFIPGASFDISLPGPVEPERLLIRKIPRGPVKGIGGPVARAGKNNEGLSVVEVAT